jgi:uncharacterized membrane protein YbhN (UPF0104 family)
MYRLRPGSFWLALALAVVGHLGFVLAFYFAARTLYQPEEIPSLVGHFLIVPIGMTVSAIPLTPGGVGVGEAAYQKLYDWIGYPMGLGFSAAFLQRVLTWVVGFAGYLVYLQMKPALKAARVAEGPPAPGTDGESLPASAEDEGGDLNTAATPCPGARS